METSTVINNLEQLANDGDHEQVILRLYDLGIELCRERKKDENGATRVKSKRLSVDCFCQREQKFFS